MSGSFEVTNQAMTLKGAIKDGTVNLNLTGVVTAPSTTVFVEPPQELLAAIHKDVNDRVLTQIADAQKAYEDLQKATADYQFELSLRGIRRLIPGIVDVAKQGMTSGITAALKNHEGTFYYATLLDIVNGYAKPYRDKLDAVAAAARAGDDATTRKALEDALLLLVQNKTLTIDITVLGIGFKYTRQILTDAQANQLTLAASYIKYIQPTSTVMISMQQIYNLIPSG